MTDMLRNLREQLPSTDDVLHQIGLQYERNAAAVDAAIEKIGDDAWEKKVEMSFGVPEPWADTLENFAWGFLLDAVHHRGQLSTYLRPMGSKVPSIYGPSADDSGS